MGLYVASLFYAIDVQVCFWSMCVVLLSFQSLTFSRVMLPELLYLLTTALFTKGFELSGYSSTSIKNNSGITVAIALILETTTLLLIVQPFSQC